MLDGGAVPADDISSEIVIKRKDPSGVTLVRWQVVLDGQVAGRLASGESLTLRVSPGSHAVSVSAVGFRTAPFEFNVDAGGRIELVAQATSHAPVTARSVRIGRERTLASEAEIVIKRKVVALDVLQQLWQVLLDGQDVGRLASGGSLTFRVSPGSHAVLVGPPNRTGIRGSPFQFDADAGERIELVTQATGWGYSVWCSAVSAMPRAGTGVAGTVVEGSRYEVPLGDEVRVVDNSRSASATTRVVRLKREWTRMSAVDMERASTTQGSAGIGLRVLELKAAAERTLSETYSERTEKRETFEEEVTLNIAPRTRCRVVFSWKEIRQKGVVQLANGSSQVRIPYEVVVGITFDQQQIDDQA